MVHFIIPLFVDIYIYIYMSFHFYYHNKAESDILRHMALCGMCKDYT